MLRIEEYHFDGLDPLQWAKMVALCGLWTALFLTAGHLTIVSGGLIIFATSVFTALVWRSIATSVKAGCWTTDRHLHVYYGDKHWSFPLSGIATISGRASPFLVQAPCLVLSNGRKVRLPATAIPPTRTLRRWFSDSAITVTSKQRQA